MGRIGFERQSVASKIVLQVEESRDLFLLKGLHRISSNKPLIYNSFLSVTFGTEITTRPVGSHHKDPKAFSREIRQVIGEWVGIDMSAHQFRHLAGLLTQRKSPGSIAALAQLLGHKRTDTARRYYAELDTLSAGREFDAIVEAELAKSRLPPRGPK